MKKLFNLSFVIIFAFLTGCQYFGGGDSPVVQHKNYPCGHPDDPKNNTNVTQDVGNSIIRNLVVNYNGEEKVIGSVYIYNACEGVYLEYRIDRDCWKFINIKVWAGTDLDELFGTGGVPANFPFDYHVYNGDDPDIDRSVFIPYKDNWYCNTTINIAAYATVYNSCDCEDYQAGTEPVTIATEGLWAGKNREDFGDVTAYVQNGKLYIHVQTDGTTITETHLQIGDDVDTDVPVNPQGTPLPGHFDYQHSNVNSTEDLYVIDLDEYFGEGEWCNKDIFIMLHLAGGGETAWAGDEDFYHGDGGNNRFAWYFNATLPDCGGGNSDCDVPAWVWGDRFETIGLDTWGFLNQLTLGCD